MKKKVVNLVRNAKKFKMQRTMRYEPTIAEIELCVELLHGRVTITQAMRVLNLSTHSGVYPWLFRNIQNGIERRKVKVNII